MVKKQKARGEQSLKYANARRLRKNSLNAALAVGQKKAPSRGPLQPQ